MKRIPPKPRIIDDHGRIIHKLRIQLTDACNFRCFYCVPQDAKFLPSTELLNAEELLYICSGLVNLGINEIRISGGEPLLRKDFEKIVEGLAKLPLLKLGVTSNGFLLKDKLSFLQKTPCQHINISLDSLNKDKFNIITKSPHFETVVASILQAKKMGFKVKVNMVALRGFNDNEILDFVHFSATHQVEVRFLELMKIGPYYDNHANLFVSAQEIIGKIEEKELLIPQSVNCDSTAFNFKTLSGARIGFIASESQPFCRFCSRLRLTATGKLRACLMSDASVNLHGQDRAKYLPLVKSVISMKPIDRIGHIQQPMYQIGG